MSIRFKKKRVLPWLFALSSLALALFLFTGACSTSRYDTASTTATPTALISVDTLKAWIDAGKVNGMGYDKVVILDVNTQANYTAGHIPGAQFLNSSDIYQNRREGPALDVNMVLDGAHMNALIQKYGIDNKTTIVFTAGTAAPSANNYLAATRAYWMFRYWGFSKERLKLVDGINSAWAAAYGLSASAAPAVVPSTFSVKNNRNLRSDLRTSLSEIIEAAEGKLQNSIVVDFRSGETNNSYAGQRGKTAGIFSALTGTTPVTDYVVFEGHIKGARAMAYTDLLDAASNYQFKPPNDLIVMLSNLGVNSTTTALVH